MAFTLKPSPRMSPSTRNQHGPDGNGSLTGGTMRRSIIVWAEFGSRHTPYPEVFFRSVGSGTYDLFWSVRYSQYLNFILFGLAHTRFLVFIFPIPISILVWSISIFRCDPNKNFGMKLFGIVILRKIVLIRAKTIF